MLFVGDHTTLVDANGNPYVDNIIVFNLSSPLEGFERLDILPTHLMLTDDNQHQFDIMYADYIINNRIVEIMKMMMPLYDNHDIYLLIYRDSGYFDAITESILKFIQQRYGILPIIINEPSDYDNIEYNQYNTSLSTIGLFNFDIDKEIYTMEKTKELAINGVATLPEGQFY